MRASICILVGLVALCAWERVDAFVGSATRGKRFSTFMSVSDPAYDALEQKLLKNSKVEAPKPAKRKAPPKPVSAPLQSPTLPPKAGTKVASPKAGVSLGALPWLVAPLVAAGALRTVLDNTKSSRVTPPKTPLAKAKPVQVTPPKPTRTTPVASPKLPTAAKTTTSGAITSPDAESRKNLLALSAAVAGGFLLLGFQSTQKPKTEPAPVVKVAPKPVEKAPVTAPKAVKVVPPPVEAPKPVEVVPPPVIEAPKAVEVVPPPVVEAPKAVEKVEVVPPPVVETPKAVEKVEVPPPVVETPKPVEKAPAPPVVEAPKAEKLTPPPVKPRVEPKVEAIVPPAPVSEAPTKAKKLQADTVNPDLLNALKNRKTRTN